MGWFTSGSGRKYAVFQAGDSGIKYVESAGGITFVGPNTGATPAMRSTPMWRITYDAASRDFTNNVLSTTLRHHVQCLYIYPKWCGDGVRE